MSRRQHDLTRGSIARTLVLFTLPIHGDIVLQPQNASINSIRLRRCFIRYLLTSYFTRIQYGASDRRSNPPTMTSTSGYTAFAGARRIASGSLADTALAARRALDRRPDAQVLIFDDSTSHQIEVDLRGSVAAVGARLQRDARPLAPPSARGPGRPRLGVVAREVTLLPRHWEWLKAQPGGTSAILRRLVEEARRGGSAGERARQSSEAVYRFMHALAGDRVGFEEALRAFYRGEREAFGKRIACWPKDIREHLGHLASVAWDDKAAAH